MITQHDARDVMVTVFEECKALREASQAEYAHSKENALRNFEQLAMQLNMTREKILWVFVSKHLDGVLAYVNGHQSQREPIEGRINDIIVYLCLLRAMIVDKNYILQVK